VVWTLFSPEVVETWVAVGVVESIELVADSVDTTGADVVSAEHIVSEQHTENHSLKCRNFLRNG